MIRRLSQIRRIIAPIIPTSSRAASSMAQSYQVAAINDLKDGEKKEVEVAEGLKILLVKVKGKYMAMSSNCTHYGAPLVKGVLSSEGRITCPW